LAVGTRRQERWRLRVLRVPDLDLERAWWGFTE